MGERGKKLRRFPVENISPLIPGNALGEEYFQVVFLSFSNLTKKKKKRKKKSPWRVMLKRS